MTPEDFCQPNIRHKTIIPGLNNFHHRLSHKADADFGFIYSLSHPLDLNPENIR